MEAYGFKIDPYDPCMENKMVGGKQITVFWNVDDLNILYMDRNNVSKMILWLD